MDQLPVLTLRQLGELVVLHEEVLGHGPESLAFVDVAMELDLHL